MDDDAILSFRSAVRRDAEVRVTAAPVLELVYAAFYLTRNDRHDEEILPWAAKLWRDAPDVARAAAGIARRDGTTPAPALFPLAALGGHAFDEAPDAFLASIPEKAEDLLARAHELGEKENSPLTAWLREPADAAWPREVQRALHDLWAEIGPGWRDEGRAAADAAAERVRASLLEHDDVVHALPEHHFAQFEKLSATLRDAAQRGRLSIVPLALAAAGGFHAETDEGTVLGFGLQADRVFARSERRVAEAAATAKALADPTRLMLLHLIVRYPAMSVTVGDLARQVGVSQPTVSGHLKQLRDAGLIRSERVGNRSFPQPEHEAVRAALAALDGLLIADEA